jgi:uncharacterized protein YegL
MNATNPVVSRAATTGDLSGDSLLSLSGLDLGQQIQEGLGVSVDDIESSEVLLVNLLLDDSGSMSGNEQAVRDGVNDLLQALRESKQAGGVVVFVRQLNSGLTFAFQLLTPSVKLDSRNFRAMGSTPLFRETLVTLGTVATKTADFENNGVPVRSITVIVTDGGDTGYGNPPADDVKRVVEDMERSERHIIFGYGIGDEAFFRQVFDEMGVRRDRQLVTTGDHHAIRHGFGIVSQSAVRASQAAGTGFSGAGVGGFGTP